MPKAARHGTTPTLHILTEGSQAEVVQVIVGLGFGSIFMPDRASISVSGHGIELTSHWITRYHLFSLFDFLIISCFPVNWLCICFINIIVCMQYIIVWRALCRICVVSCGVTSDAIHGVRGWCWIWIRIIIQVTRCHVRHHVLFVVCGVGGYLSFRAMTDCICLAFGPFW